MAVSLLAPPPRGNIWPRTWAVQHGLLERQHLRLEARLDELIGLHQSPQAWEPLGRIASERACRRLIKALRLHLRLEERWLGQWGCLCPGHLASHGEAAALAAAGFLQAGPDRRERLRWLLNLRAWFLPHRDGADARAYSLAHAASQP